MLTVCQGMPGVRGKRRVSEFLVWGDRQQSKIVLIRIMMKMTLTGRVAEGV